MTSSVPARTTSSTPAPSGRTRSRSRSSTSPRRPIPVGDYAILDSTVDPRFLDQRNRPALAQTFESTATGGQATVIVNHLKSKGSACEGDPDTGDGQGNCNLTRVDAAEALVDWIASDPTDSGDLDAIVIGDLNSYAKEDPIGVFEDAGYENMIRTFLGDEAYSFVFQGQSGYLDHALADATLPAQVTGTTEWHINADEPIVLDYNTDFKSDESHRDAVRAACLPLVRPRPGSGRRRPPRVRLRRLPESPPLAPA